MDKNGGNNCRISNESTTETDGSVYIGQKKRGGRTLKALVPHLSRGDFTAHSGKLVLLAEKP